jgi:hypothetical protein
MNPAKSTLTRWRKDRIALNPPASALELARLAELVGGVVPADLLDLYLVANGMVDNAMDIWHVSLWSIDCAESITFAGSDDYFCRSRSARVAHHLAMLGCCRRPVGGRGVHQRRSAGRRAGAHREP